MSVLSERIASAVGLASHLGRGVRRIGTDTLIGRLLPLPRTLGDLDPLLEPLRAKIANDSTIPIVFPAMALTYDELGELRALIRASCPAVDSDAFRRNASSHRTCTK